MAKERKSQSGKAEALPGEADGPNSALLAKIGNTVIGPSATDGDAKMSAEVRQVMDLIKARIGDDEAPKVNAQSLALMDRLIAAIDDELTKQINLVLHHPEFQRLESAWRGLEDLDANTEDKSIRIQVMDISKEELHEQIKDFKVDKRGPQWIQSPLFQRIYRDKYNTPGEFPISALVGDYYFTHSGSDVETLRGLANVCAMAHAPLLTSVAPGLFGLSTWESLLEVADYDGLFQGNEYTEWRGLRSEQNSIYLNMCLPRFLGRRPYGPKDERTKSFEFTEDVRGENEKYLWTNAAYARMKTIHDAQSEYGWTARIRGERGGGLIKSLPIHMIDNEPRCPTELAIDGTTENELSDLGFMTAQHIAHTPDAKFDGGRSLYAPQKYQNAEDTKAEFLMASMPNILVCSRFAHALKKYAESFNGDFRELDELRVELNRWVNQYVPAQAAANERERAKNPLAEARVDVEEHESIPGYYFASISLRPHYQLEGLEVGINLVSSMPERAIAR